MQDTIALIQSHRSIRKFTDEAILSKHFNLILESMRSAATSSFMQCVSVVQVNDPDKRKRLVELTGNQPYVKTAAEFLVFCADYNRHLAIVPDGNVGYIEQLITASVDAGLMGQNALLSAQSLGLGGVYIGGIRNNPLDVCALLQLPKQVFPLFGLCLGHPDPEFIPEQKPRLPLDIIVHTDSYHPLDQVALEAYDATVRQYYQQRSSSQKAMNWSTVVKQKLKQEARPFMQSALHQQAFAKK